MQIDGLGEIEAVGFDIDGTLYSQWKLHFWMFAHFLRYCQFFLKYGLVRSALHKIPFLADFRAEQARLMATSIGCGCSVEKAAARLERIAYAGLVPYFDKVPLCDGVRDVFSALHNAGVKIALLSDFPPEQKGNLWGLKEYVDVALGTESIGALKPSSVPFKVMAQMLDVQAEKILYVGNSAKYDVKGAKNSGMKTAYFVSKLHKLLLGHIKEADITFSNYYELRTRLGL